MIYKRATAALRAAGITDIEIKKYLWGPAPMYKSVQRQTSKCFSTWQAARDAVLAGYRPEVLR